MYVWGRGYYGACGELWAGLRTPDDEDSVVGDCTRVE